MNIDPNADYTGYRPMECAHPGCEKRSIKYLVPADSVDYCDEHTPDVPVWASTVTDPATLCQYGLDGNHDDRCLLPADHVDSGRWHAGLGWTASLGATTRKD